MNSLNLIRGLNMPHDKQGKKIEVGDLVMLPCRITHINSQDEKACNITLEALYSQESGYKPVIACAANQSFKQPPVSAAIEHLRRMLTIIDNEDCSCGKCEVFNKQDILDAKTWLAVLDSQQD